MSYLNDPRENCYDGACEDNGYVSSWLEEDNRHEKRYQWGAMVLDLCDMSPEEYQKTIFVTKPADTGETATYTITWVVNGVSSTTSVTEGNMPQHSTPATYTAYTGTQNEYVSTYRFQKWEPTIVAASSDATYTAVFTETKANVKYDLVFTYVDETGATVTVSTTKVAWGTDLSTVAKPTVQGGTYDCELTGVMPIGGKTIVGTYTADVPLNMYYGLVLKTESAAKSDATGLASTAATTAETPFTINVTIDEEWQAKSDAADEAFDAGDDELGEQLAAEADAIAEAKDQALVIFYPSEKFDLEYLKNALGNATIDSTSNVTLDGNAYVKLIQNGDMGAFKPIQVTQFDYKIKLKNK